MKLQAIAALAVGFACGYWAVSTYLKSNREPNIEAGKLAANAMLAAVELPENPEVLLLRAFKREGELELWAGDSGKTLKLVKTYAITARSGGLGPKRKEGDRQVPQGFYKIVGFNPNSAYHLSMRIDYPNASDKILSDKEEPGSDIFIHGKAVTIGCIPIGDEAIAELYALCESVFRRSPIQVHIFPARLDETGAATMRREFASSPGLLRFWDNLKEGFRLFEETRQPLKVAIGDDGVYAYR